MAWGWGAKSPSRYMRARPILKRSAVDYARKSKIEFVDLVYPELIEWLGGKKGASDVARRR